MTSEQGLAIRVNGEQLPELPSDLYIPPDALRVFLEAFEGPLDLLLYLIRKHNIDILNIPLAEITRQYSEYIDLMQELKLELAAEYLAMAAMLAEIKSRMLLPRTTTDEVTATPEDPRAELVRRLQDYERFKQAALKLDTLAQLDRDYFVAYADFPSVEKTVKHPDINLSELLDALKNVMQRAKLYANHEVVREPLSIRERMSQVLSQVKLDEFTPFVKLFTVEEGRMGVVVTFIAILELIRQSSLELVQAQPYAAIYIKARHQASTMNEESEA